MGQKESIDTVAKRASTELKTSLIVTGHCHTQQKYLHTTANANRVKSVCVCVCVSYMSSEHAALIGLFSLFPLSRKLGRVTGSTPE